MALAVANARPGAGPIVFIMLRKGTEGFMSDEPFRIFY